MGGPNWRVVYKSLDLLMHIIKFGHERVVEDARDHQIVLRPLQDFAYFDPENGNDRGRGIRTLTKQIFDLLKDRSALEKLRADAHKQRSKLQGINSTAVSSGGGYGGGGSSGFGSSGGGSGGGYNSNYSGNSYKNRSYEEEARDWKYGSSYDPYDKSKDDDDSKKKKKKDSSDEDTESEREPTPKPKKKKKKKKK